LEIYPDAKGVPGPMVIRIAATRHVEFVVLMQNCGVEDENRV
jgi:hypothetical protein